MLLINSKRLRPGMKAAAVIERPEGNSAPLVSAGAILDEASIAQLRKLGIDRCLVEHGKLDILKKQAISDGLKDSYQHLVSVLDEYYSHVNGRIGIEDYNRLCRVCAEMVTRLVAERGKNTNIHTELLSTGPYTAAAHAANITYLALMTALKVESFMVEERRSAGALAACDITNLAVGAALHDIGKTQIPSTFKVHEPIDEPPSRSYLDHVIRGGKMISDRVSPTARSVVMHHHQRYDGGGFPDMAIVTNKRRSGTLAGAKIHIFSRIVSLCDHFDNLLHPDAKAVSPCQAMSAMLDDSLTGRFDPYLLWAFSSILPPLPVASHIRLDNGSEAVVARHNPQYPCRPLVLLLDDKWHPSEALDLAKHSERSITHWLDSEIDGYLYDAPPEPVDKSVIKETAEAMLAQN